MYRRKYVQLHEAVSLIAERLAAAQPDSYPGHAAAINGARKQLLEALFEGAIQAEGVRCYPADPPTYKPPSVEYDEWHQIKSGVWSHERCEPSSNTYRLDTISVHWDEDFIDYFDSGGEWAERIDDKIRLGRDAVDREFPATDILPAADALLTLPVKPAYRTGLPGRPSPKYLASQEMKRRAKAGLLCSGLAAEIRELCRWLELEHADAPPATPKALEAALRHEYWGLKRSKDL